MSEAEFIIVSQGDVAGIGWPLFKEIIRKKENYFNLSYQKRIKSIIVAGFAYENDISYLKRYFLLIEIPEKPDKKNYRKWLSETIRKVQNKARKKPIFLSLRKEAAYTPGQANTVTAMKSYRAFQLALRLWRKLPIAALVTLPVSKEMIMKAGIPFTGHTRTIEDFTGKNAYMCMYHPRLSVIVLTEHIPLSQVSKDIYKTNFSELEKGLHFFQETFRAKKGFAMTGLNPHSGENGRIGDEESFLQFHLAKMQKNSIPIEGLIPADSVFTNENRKKYSLIITHYHDQGLVPFKALIGLKGINVTLNQPKLRVSPSHGTAYEIASGKNANPDSIIKSIQFAMRYNKKWIHSYSSH